MKSSRESNNFVLVGKATSQCEVSDRQTDRQTDIYFIDRKEKSLQTYLSSNLFYYIIHVFIIKIIHMGWVDLLFKIVHKVCQGRPCSDISRI